jgi:predicted RNase H-like HicB family nuclease
MHYGKQGEVAQGAFPDVPAITQGDTMEEAMEMAPEALVLALTFYTEKGVVSQFEKSSVCALAPLMG